MNATLTSRIARIARITVVGATLTAALLGFAPQASALSADTTMGCGGATSASIQLARVPVTASGTPGWSYSVFFAGDYRNPWVRSNWVASYANAGPSAAYELVNGRWVQPGPNLDLPAPPHYGIVHVWQQKFEVLNGQWSVEWVYLGNCTPPPMG